MSIKKFVEDVLKISEKGMFGDDGGYVIDIESSNKFGKIFSSLENNDGVFPLEDSQVITEQGSSLIYEAENEPYIINLIADFDGNVYQLVVTEVE